MARSPKQNAFLHAKKPGQTVPKLTPPKPPAIPGAPAVTEAHVMRGQKTYRAK